MQRKCRITSPLIGGPRQWPSLKASPVCHDSADLSLFLREVETQNLCHDSARLVFSSLLFLVSRAFSIGNTLFYVVKWMYIFSCVGGSL